jgi:hypothetical protein
MLGFDLIAFGNGNITHIVPKSGVKGFHRL